MRAVNRRNSIIISKTDTVRIEAKLSDNKAVAGLTLEYFYDNIEKEGETKTQKEMTLADGTWTHTLPKKTDRTLVRYRMLADFGKGPEIISPRPSDPYQWHSYFVMPRSTGSNKYFELLVPRAGTSQLSKNMSANPRSGYRPAKHIRPRGPWNDTVHGILVHDGVVRDVYARWNGSFYRRNKVSNARAILCNAHRHFSCCSSIAVCDYTAVIFMSYIPESNACFWK